MKPLSFTAWAVITALAFLASCKQKDKGGEPFPSGTALNEVASSQQQWTGVAVSRENRLFASIPLLTTDTIPYSVVEVKGGNATPFPNQTWNTRDTAVAPQDRFVGVQSVYVDDENFLWVLDPANNQNRGVIPGGPKLLKFDINNRELVQRISFDESVVFPTSYLNDVRVDTGRDVAYITDSGRGAIIVVNLSTGQSRRLLSNSPSTKSENLIITVEGRVFRNKDGSLPSFNADGIALNSDRSYLYYTALTAKSLYRIGTQWLLDESLTESPLNEKVEYVGAYGPVDGMAFGNDGNLYLTSVEQNAITRLTPQGQWQGVVRSEKLKWPDSFAVGVDGAIYVTTSQLHIPASERKEPFKIFQFRPQ